MNCVVQYIVSVTIVTADNICTANAEDVKLAVGSANTARPVFVIVPDRFTLQCEKMLVEDGGCLLNTRVLTFSMLYNVISEELGEEPPLLDKTNAVLFIWRAIQAVRDDLQFFRRSVNQYAFAEKMFNTINQLTSCMADFKNLEKNAGADVTRRKMHDIQIIYAKYRELTGELTDSARMLGWLIENVRNSKLVSSACIYITGFEHLSVQRSQVVREILQHAHSFTAGVRKSSEFEELLGQICFEIKHPASSTMRHPSMAEGNSQCDVSCVRCDNVYDEAARIANRICGLVARGARYKNIAVVICDYDDTVAIFIETFRQRNIPVNVDVGMKLIEHPYAKSLRDQMAKSPWYTKYECAEDDPAKQKIDEILEICKKQSREIAVSDGEFLNMFCSLCSAAKISDVPNYADRVLLVSSEEHEPSFIPYLFVAGASDGAFPVVTSDTDIITEQDIESMAIVIEPSASVQNTRARNHARNILGSATKQLFISCSTTNVKGERVSPCNLVKSEFLIDNDEYSASISRAISSTGFAVPNLYAKPDNLKCGCELFFSKRNASVTQLENFSRCPYYHFLTNGLRVKKRGDNLNATMGTILHTFAEQYVKTKCTQESDEIVKEILKDYTLPKYARSAAKKQCKLIAKFLTKEISTSQYKPHLFEHKLENVINGINVRGVADRVDVDAQGHAIVLDYKSGMVYGPKLQLPLYMGFLRDKYMPDGAYYLNLKTFKKTEVSSDEIEPALEKTINAIKDIKSGVVDKSPNFQRTCEYCPAGAMCIVWEGSS